jgi:hypothetical protein
VASDTESLRVTNENHPTISDTRVLSDA